MKMPLNNNWAAFLFFADRKRLLWTLFYHKQLLQTNLKESYEKVSIYVSGHYDGKCRMH